jgi:hypothetical protein
MAMYGEKLKVTKPVKVPPVHAKPPRLWPVKPEIPTSSKLYGAPK